MEPTVEKENLKLRLHQSPALAIEYLYTRYSSMLLGFTLQFISDKKDAEQVLMLIFEKVYDKMAEIPDAVLSVYCWLQAEARKVILDHKNKTTASSCNSGIVSSHNRSYYEPLLQEATDQQRTVFIEMYINGRSIQQVAAQLQADTASVQQLLRESLLIIRKNLQ